jgi:hypothetical protein
VTRADARQTANGQLPEREWSDRTAPSG